MSELAQETFEHHEHLRHHPEDGNAKRAALAIGVLAAALAVSEMAERSNQNAYLAHHIGASNEYAFYQARQNRALILNQTAAVLGAIPGSPDSAKVASDARSEATRLLEDSDRGNGAKQIQARAAAETTARDAALHRYEWFELVTSGLQIAIVLASVSVVTRITSVLWVGVALGLAAASLGLVVVTGLI